MTPIVVDRETGKLISAPVFTQEQKNKAWETIVRTHAQRHPELFQIADEQKKEVVA